MSAVFKRELKAYFTSPLGYVFVFFYVIISGLLFGSVFSSNTAEISAIFSVMSYISMFIIPVLTMRSFSEERKQKTDQALFTAPVKLSAVVMGKFFAAVTVFLIPNIVTIIYQLVFAAYTQVNWVIYFCCLFGIILFALSMISIGIFISALTESQMTAVIVSLAVSIFINMIDFISSLINISAITTITNWIAFSGRLNTFIQGIIDYSNIAFFLSIAAVFLFLTVRVQEKKRWS